MPNNVDLTAAKTLVTTAFMHIANNDPSLKQKVRGAYHALASPSMQGMRREIDPAYAVNPEKVKWEKVGNKPIPKVRYSWNPMNAKSVVTSRTAISANAGTAPSTGVEATVAYDLYFENASAVLQQAINQIQPELVNNYYQAYMSDKVNMPVLMPQIMNSQIGSIASSLWQEATAGIFPAYADALMTRLFAGVGTNPAYPSLTLPSVSAPLLEVAGFVTTNGQTTVNNNMTTALRKMKDKAKVQGRPVLIGGDKWLEWHDAQGIVAVNNYVGLDLVNATNRLQHDFYYDENADAIFGTDVALWIEPNAVCEVSWRYNGSPFAPVGDEIVGLTYETLDANIVQYQQAQGQNYNNNLGGLSLKMDLRILASNGTADFPEFKYLLNLGGGLWRRPVDYFTTDAGNPYKTYTGICAVKIL